MAFTLRKEKHKIYFFTKRRRLVYVEVEADEKDARQTFKYEDGRYLLDISAVQFFTEDKKPVFFYVEGIPNPIKYDFKKYIQKFNEAKRENPEAVVFDDNGDLLDISFSSEALERYKNDTFLQKLQAKMTPEHIKIIFGLIGVMALMTIINLIIIFMVKK